MKIYFVETDSSEQEFFQRELDDHELYFVGSLNEVAPDAEAVSTFIYSSFNATFLKEHPALRLIATRSTTYDHIDLESCARLDITVCNVASYGDHVVAEHTFALMLALTRRLREAMTVDECRGFSYESFRGLELKSKTLGIIGTGRIGLNVIPVARAFGMKVVAYDIAPRPLLANKLGFEYVTLDKLLRCSDIISLHAALTPENHHLLDRKAFAKCRPGVLIINTARGRLIDTLALLDAMDEGIVAGVGLDVLGEESVLRQKASHVITDEITRHLQGDYMPDEPREGDPARKQQIEKLMRLGELLSRPNVVFTPHTAFNCVEAITRINQATVKNIRAFAAGAPINTVTPDMRGIVSETFCDEEKCPAMTI